MRSKGFGPCCCCSGLVSAGQKTRNSAHGLLDPLFVCLFVCFSSSTASRPWVKVKQGRTLELRFPTDDVRMPGKVRCFPRGGDQSAARSLFFLFLNPVRVTMIVSNLRIEGWVREFSYPPRTRE